MPESPANDAPFRLIADVEFGDGVIVQPFVNLYRCVIGDQTRIGPFVEIQAGVSIGARCKLQSHTFVCTGVTIEDEVFIGHGVMFINDKRPRATTDTGDLQTDDDWVLLPARIGRGASIGSGAVIMGGLTVGKARADRRRRRCHPRRPPGRNGRGRSGTSAAACRGAARLLSDRLGPNRKRRVLVRPVRRRFSFIR
jgi:UDP-3-O-[3-hydroxymyristoyl] glucosamine N-acyltransferase